MKKHWARSASAGLAGVASLLWITTAAAVSAAAEPSPRMLCHDVFFTLKDDSAEAKTQLIAGCKKYLSNHPGTVWFAAGPLAEELQRDVNDRGFHVALHLVFIDKASHDKYAEAPRHLKFIEEYKDNWEQVRVFDSWLDVSSHADIAAEPDRADAASKPRLPDRAARFAGLIQGKVVNKDGGEIVVAVEKVAQVWGSSQAEDPQALVGKKVLVRVPGEGNRYASAISRFVKGLQAGQTVLLDVAHKGEGEALTILELSEEQRETRPR